MITPATRAAFLPLLALALLGPLAAEETRIWRQSDFEEFRKGDAEGVSLSSDGRVRLAAALEEIHDAPASYIWDLAVGPDGSVYAAVGPEARVVRVRPGGDSEVVFETDAVEVHAVAVAADGTLYAATNPSGKVFRISADGDSAEIYDPGSAVIWDLAIGPDGELYVATGDGGEIHRVAANGDGGLFYSTGETHVRTLAIDAEGRLLAGTDPGGMVFRISEAGGEARGFVLYESPKAELTAIVVDADGLIYAAGAGAKSAGGSPAPAAPASPEGASQPGANSSPRPSPLRGGSEIVRIAPNGAPSMYWESAEEIVYALGLDGAGRLLVGTGAEGRLYRIDDERVSWLERTLPSDQVTAMAAGSGGRSYIATSNVGKVFLMGPQAEERGELLSEAFDSGGFARWGRLEYSGGSSGVELSLRTGNVKRPGATWSQWSAPISAPTGGRTGSPGARYGQWRLALSGAAAEVAEVRQYFRPSNRAPEITHLELTPPSFRLPPRSRVVSPVVSVALPPLGAPPSRRSTSSAPTTLTQAPGWMGLRWLAEDPNDDSLSFSVAIRGEGESAWTPLENEVDGDAFSFDATGFADGWYELQVTASDAESNPRNEALSASRETELFLIDNTAPSISGLTAELSGGRLRLRLEASDASSRIREAAASIDGGEWIEITPADGLFDGRELQLETELEAAATNLVAVRVRDQHGNQAVAKASVGP